MSQATVEVSSAVPQLLADLSAVRWAGLGCAVVLVTLGLYCWTKFRSNQVMLLDFCCFDPPDRYALLTVPSPMGAFML